MNWDNILRLIVPALGQTLYMVGASSLIAVALGLPFAIVLYLTRPDGFYPCRAVYRLLNWFINILRSLPFVILMFLMFPVTRLLVGKIIGSTASIVPIAASAAPFVARLFESHFLEIDRGIIEAARAMGSRTGQIIGRVILPGSLPALVNAVTITIINVIAYSAMAGLIGGGGLGDVANVYGYQMRRYDIMYSAVVVIIVIVQIVQHVGNTIAAKLNHK